METGEEAAAEEELAAEEVGVLAELAAAVVVPESTSLGPCPGACALGLDPAATMTGLTLVDATAGAAVVEEAPKTLDQSTSL